MVAKPLVTFANPLRAVVDYLKPLASPVTVSANYPTGGPGSATVPHIQVGDDGTPEIQYPARQLTTIRVTYWHTSLNSARDGASLMQGYLATHPGDSSLWNVLPLTGPIVGTDPDTGLAFAYCTFRASTRPLAVA